MQEGSGEEGRKEGSHLLQREGRGEEGSGEKGIVKLVFCFS